MDRAIILAGGPSLCAEDAATAMRSGWPVIAVNNAWQLAPGCDVIYAGDLEWWEHYFPTVANTGAALWTCHSQAAPRFGLNRHHAAGSYNSGQRAIQFAASQGAKVIILLGFDCYCVTGCTGTAPILRGSITPRSKACIAGTSFHRAGQTAYPPSYYQCITEYVALMFPQTIPQCRAGQRAIIVASGPSAAGFTPPDGVTVIAVNGAIDWLSRADYFFTLDPSPVNLRRLTQRREGVTYCAAGVTLPSVLSFARVSKRGAEPRPRGGAAWWLWRWSAVKTLATDPGKIHSGNSAWGGLGLAYHLGFTDVALVGVDGSTAPRIEGGVCNNLSHLPLLFASALPQINVVSCGRLTGIPRTSIKDWITQ